MADGVPRDANRSGAKRLFTEEGLLRLAAFDAENVLLAFDYDGTLAPIVGDPTRARLRPRTRALLRALASLYPVAVLSGRHEADITQRVADTGVWVACGYDWRWFDGSRPPSAVRMQVEKWRQTLAEVLRLRSDVSIEDKEFVVALHYRQAQDADDAFRAITAAARALIGARVTAGKRVVNVAPADMLSKADILGRLRHDFGCDAVLYVGDDAEDEEVFRLQRLLPLTGIRVGPSVDTEAAYFLQHQRDVDALLAHLYDLRR